MLIIDSKDCENIDKALKKYKKKFEKSKTLLKVTCASSLCKTISTTSFRSIESCLQATNFQRKNRRVSQKLPFIYYLSSLKVS